MQINGPGSAYYNRNAIVSRSFRLKMRKERRIASEKNDFVLKKGLIILQLEALPKSASTESPVCGNCLTMHPMA